jgi:hypothetical protein
MNPNRKPYLFDNPKNVRRVVRGLLLACVILLGLDVLVHRHVSHSWEAMYGFYAVYGLVSCVLLVLLAKEMRLIVMRDEHYYRDDDHGGEGRGD